MPAGEHIGCQRTASAIVDASLVFAGVWAWVGARLSGRARQAGGSNTARPEATAPAPATLSMNRGASLSSTCPSARPGRASTAGVSTTCAPQPVVGMGRYLRSSGGIWLNRRGLCRECEWAATHLAVIADSAHWSHNLRPARKNFTAGVHERLQLVVLPIALEMDAEIATTA